MEKKGSATNIDFMSDPRPELTEIDYRMKSHIICCCCCFVWEFSSPYPSQFVLSNGAGVHEGLSDDRQHRVHVVRGLHVKYELGIFHNVDPETQWQTRTT